MSATDPETILGPRHYPDWSPSNDRALSDGSPIRFANGMSWEMDSHGSHRVVSEDGVGGDWASYTSVAVSPCGRFLVFTNYWEGSVPTERLLWIELIPRSEGS